MKLKIWLPTIILLVCFFLVNSLSAQTIHQISAGENTLNDAINAASSGDIIELIDSGGLYSYNGSDKMYITITLTIRAMEGLAKQPIVRNVTPTAGSPRIFEIRKGGNLTLKGLNLDGRTQEGGAAFCKNIIRSEDVAGAADSFRFVVKVEDCFMHDSKEVFFKAHTFTIGDTIVFKNCIFDEAYNEAILLRESTAGGGPTIKYLEVENCTFTKIGREALYLEFSNPVVRFNHCTFDSVAYRENKRIINPKDVTDVQIKNCIFTNQGGTYTTSIELFGNSTISYCDTFNIAAVKLNGSATIGAGMLDVDPLYTNPASYDYSLQSTSPVLGMADDGLAMGDLRWAPQAVLPHIIYVEAGENTLADSIAIAQDGDILELITSGGLYSYNGSDKMYITKTLTIRAKEGLAEKPIVRNITPTAGSPRIFEIRKGGNLTLKGLNLDGRTQDGGAAFCKNLIRSEDVAGVADSFRFVLKVDDCFMHDTKEAMVKMHTFTIGDTLLFTNCIFDEAYNEAILLRESTTGGGPTIKYLEVENCTFTKIGREALYLEFSNPIVRFNHCTFDSVAYRENKRIINPKDVTDVQIKNCIFTNQGGTFTTSIELFGNSTISYCDTFNVATVKLNGSATIGAGMLDVDPLYNNPAKYDYRLATTSPVRGMADDGRAMGDLRWEASPDQFRLTVLTEGKGVVNLDPPGNVYNPGTVVKLTAVPDPGWKLASWEGVLVFPPDNPVATITMDADKTVKAKFESTAPKVSLTVDTLGLGHVDVNPAPVDGKYYQGTQVTMTAVPQTNWKFVEWLGDLTGMVSPVTFSVDSNMHVTASFASIFTQFKLTIETSGLGSVTQNPAPILATYDTSTVVVLTTFPVQGWQFSSWSGDLTGTGNPDSVVMDSDKNVMATFTEMTFERHALEIDTTWDLYDAVEFANNNSFIDSLILITSGGLYTSYNTEDVAVTAPLTIVAASGLAEKPIITNSDPEKTNLDVFRVFDDFTIKGVVLDGGHPKTFGMKYGIRLRHYTGSDSVKNGTNITILDCDFKNFFEMNPPYDGHALKFDVGYVAGTVRIENSTFTNFGYEAIRISETEKYPTDRALDSLIVKNCTFTNIDAECVRYYSDLNTATPDAPVIIEHITINNSATRAFYLKNSGGAIVRDVIIANSRMSSHGRDADLMDAQGPGTVVSHIDTFKVAAVPILAAKGGTVDNETIYSIDPKFEDAANLNYALLPASHLYGLAHDGEALGDLRWATNQPTHVSLLVLVEGQGDVLIDPLPIGKTYDPNTVVTLTAVPDSGWFFAGWSGDLSGEKNPETITLDKAKNVSALFKVITGVSENSELPTEYNLNQNYPNPFNPSTTIGFALKQPGKTTLVVYDVLGRVVATLLDRQMDAGRYSIKFQIPDMVSGVYFYKIESGDFVSIKKMIMVN